ncbi:GlsB/YeaQ/YmgE family stress response membrane protein [Sphingomonas bacterium]|uniref:GlsB/YeaQ/YmgE family stress response membrane protein n=1 Tax=Sphingomonas bacterium TaxID=1895847 RepID=UPI001C2D1948|nr:GlsB/YeaQ/YmgE family stress response membrane protein [Sphingomonas bacterium]
MGIIIWLIVGGVAGWLAGMIMRDNNSIIVNIVVGIVGAVIAGLLFGGGANLNNGVTITSFIYSLVGAIILLAIVNLVRRGRVR